MDDVTSSNSSRRSLCRERGLKLLRYVSAMTLPCRSLCRERGLKLRYEIENLSGTNRRSLCRERGLKLLNRLRLVENL